jgi:hypothetical protein
MARSTFEGPILSGDNRFGPLRDVGYADLVQATDIDFTVTTAGTAYYSGGSGQFVWGNGIPNLPGQLYTPSSSYSTSGPTTTTPTADPTGTSGTIYRGVVMYLPTGCEINDIFIDCGVVPTLSAGTIGNVSVKVGNAFNTSTYAATGTISAVGRQALSTFTDAQFVAQTSTSSDIQNPNLGAQPTFFSQVVFTVLIPFTVATGVLATGKFYFTVRYTQPDGNIGTLTTYPYGNFD